MIQSMGKRRDIEHTRRDEQSAKRFKKQKHLKDHSPPDDFEEFDEQIIFASESDYLDLDADNSDILNSQESQFSSSIMKSVNVTPQNLKYDVPSTSASTSGTSKKRKNRGQGKESGTSSDEERWLDAIESGKFEEVDDELKKIKDPKLMTARQRAMYERNTDKELSPSGEILLSLPTGYKEKVMTAEAIQKAALKSQKRKQQADEKREKDKKKTMERLLKKQETKQRSATKFKTVRLEEPMISYRNTYDGATISFPIEHGIFPPIAKTQTDPPKPVLCGIDGCTNLKIYNCSKTNLPLCSFACYRKNVANVRELMC